MYVTSRFRTCILCGLSRPAARSAAFHRRRIPSIVWQLSGSSPCSRFPPPTRHSAVPSRTSGTQTRASSDHSLFS